MKKNLAGSLNDKLKTKPYIYRNSASQGFKCGLKSWKAISNCLSVWSWVGHEYNNSNKILIYF